MIYRNLVSPLSEHGYVGWQYHVADGFLYHYHFSTEWPPAWLGHALDGSSEVGCNGFGGS